MMVTNYNADVFGTPACFGSFNSRVMAIYTCVTTRLHALVAIFINACCLFVLVIKNQKLQILNHLGDIF